MDFQNPESSMWSHLFTSSPHMATPRGRAAPSQQHHPKQPRSPWEHFLYKVRCSRNSALYPKPPDSDVLPRSGTEMVLFFQPKLINSPIGKTESKTASKGLIRSALKSS